MSEILPTILDWLLSHGLRLLIILVFMIVVLKLIRMVSKRILASVSKKREEEEFLKRAETLQSVIRFALTITIVTVAVIMILGELGIEIGPILAAAGVIGVAIGFGAQNVVKDFLSGIFILMEDQFRIGDWIEISGVSGLVEKVNLRITVLRDLNGNVHFVRNGYIDITTNMTKEYSRYIFDIGVAYREDVDEVMGIMKEVDEEMRNDPAFSSDIYAPLEILGLDQFGDSALVVKAYTTTKPSSQWKVGREFKKRLKKRFDDRNIEIPFPHLTLYPGMDKDGNAPPLHLHQEPGRQE
jgi:small conductance mechanosensitive channel